jgi:acetyl-CoA synthetase
VRLLGSVGEAINPSAWRWFHDHVGGGRAPVVDTWWQSETGAAMIAPLPGVSARKPGSATRPLPGIAAAVVDDDGAPVPPGTPGLLVVTRPWPGMARTIWGDPERYRDAYWSRFARRGWFLAGDGARVDDEGDVWLLGRVDEVINVSGHRLSTVEIESALVSHPLVGEAGVTGVPDDVTGQSVAAFVVPSRPPGDLGDARAWADRAAEVAGELGAHVARVIGPVARPRRVVVVPDLPKTRSGKIMRRLLADLATDGRLGDVTSLTDAGSVHRIAAVLAAGRSTDREDVA